MKGIAYAIQQYSVLKNVWVYLAAGNGAQLGAQQNMKQFVNLVQSILYIAGGYDFIHGFATNIGTYQPLSNVSDDRDPCDLKAQDNTCYNEARYIQFMDLQLTNAGILGMNYITDTSRNGNVENMSPPPCDRMVCNDKQTGIHYIPTVNTTSTGIGEIINAFVWIAVPGISEGSSAASDTFYSDPNAISPAPPKGNWFPKYFLSMCQHAHPSLD